MGGGDAELYKFFAYLRYQPLVKYTICKYLLLFSRIPFCFIVSFTVQKLFSLMKSHLLIFTFVFLAWWNRSKNILLKLMSKSAPPTFSSRNCGFKSYVKAFNPFWVLLVCIWCEKAVPFDSSASNCWVFPIPHIKEVVFSTLYILTTFVAS